MERTLKISGFGGKISGQIRMKKTACVRVLVTLAASVPLGFFCPSTLGQGGESSRPVVVQPGAPGKPTKTLPPSTKATLPPRSHADVEFMQGMIMHHSQAVEMTALIRSHTENKELRALGARISSSQTDEIKFMKRWLASRGEATPPVASSTGTQTMPGMDMSREASATGRALMPGMLTPEQME